MSLSKTANRLLALAVCAYSVPSFAFFDAEATVGKRWYQWEGKDTADVVGKHGVQSQEVQVSAHLSPIPLIPIGFGALINVGSPDKNDLAYMGNVTDAKVFQAALDFTAWLSLVPILTPYVRVTFPVYSAVAIKSKITNETVPANPIEVVTTGKLTGYHLDVGAKFNFLPLVKLLVEVGTAGETYKQDEIKKGGLKFPTDSDRPVASKSLSLGVEVGI